MDCWLVVVVVSPAVVQLYNEREKEKTKRRRRISYRCSLAVTYIVIGISSNFVHRFYGDQKVFFHKLRILQ